MVHGQDQAQTFGKREQPFAPTHVSHKQVEAYPIAAAEFHADGSGKVGVEHPERGYIVVPVPPGFLRSPGAVSEGDMLVRYAPTVNEPNGYLSHSPRAVFEDGYSSIAQATSGLAFGQAIAALKAGARVARSGWNGKGMWLSLSGPLPGREIAFENFWSSNNADFARQNGGSATVLPCITMKTATGEILMGWLASQTDMLAEDWCVVSGAAATVEAPGPAQDLRSRGEPRIPRREEGLPNGRPHP